MKNSNRVVYLDFIRIIACFMVILNHTEGYIDCFKITEKMPIWILISRLFVGMIVKIAVPLFFMISGSLLLEKDRSYSYITKRILKMFGILFIFSIAANVLNKGYLYIPGFIRTFASADVDGARPYWYLYAYIGVLMMLPFLRYIAQNLSLKDTIYLITLRFLFCGLTPALFLILNLKLDSNIHLSDKFNPALIMVDSLFYVLIGFGLDRLLSIGKITKRKALLTVIAFIISVLAEEFLTYITNGQNVFNGFDFVMAISLFIFIKKLFSNKTEYSAIDRAVSLTGSLTFGIYLLDPCIGSFLKPLIHSIYPAIPSLLFVSMLYSLISMIVCGMITFAWKVIVNKMKALQLFSHSDHSHPQL